MTINERVTYFINTVTVAEILKRTDLGQSALYKIASGGGVSAITLEKICKAFPNLNHNWILVETGTMWNDSTLVENKKANEPSINYGKRLSNTEGVGLLENLIKRIEQLENQVQLLNNQNSKT